MKHIVETTCLLGLSAYLAFYFYQNAHWTEKEIISSPIEYKEVIERKIEKLTKETPPPEIIDSPMVRQDLPPKNLAPEGVFYLITAKSKEFESGIVSYRVGTLVTIIEPGKIRMPDGTVLDAKDEEVSNDLDLVAFVSSIKNAPVAVDSEVKKDEPVEVPPLVERKDGSRQYNNPLNEKAKDRVDFGLKKLNGERRPFTK